MQGKSPVFDTWLLNPEGKGMRRHCLKAHVAPKNKTLAKAWQVKEEVYVLGKLSPQKVVADNMLTQKFKFCRIIYHL